MLVGPNGDAHVYSPSPADAKKLADAKVVVSNGLGFEGWIGRLVKASGSKAPIVVASKGVKPRRRGGARSWPRSSAAIRTPGSRSRTSKSMSPTSATR